MEFSRNLNFYDTHNIKNHEQAVGHPIPNAYFLVDIHGYSWAVNGNPWKFMDIHEKNVAF